MLIIGLYIVGAIIVGLAVISTVHYIHQVWTDDDVVRDNTDYLIENLRVMRSNQLGR